MKRSPQGTRLTVLLTGGLVALLLMPARAAFAQAVVLDATANFGDGKTRLLSRTAGGAATIRVLNAAGALDSTATYGPFAGWTARALAPSVNNKSRLLWGHTDGRISLWTLSPTGTAESAFETPPYINTATGQPLRAVDLAEDANRRWCLLLTDDTGVADVTVKDENLTTSGNTLRTTYGPYTGWRPIAVAAGPDQTFRLLWRNNNGAAALWRLQEFGIAVAGSEFGPFSGWSPTDVTVGGDGNSRLLWANTSGAAAIWVVNPAGVPLLGREFGPFGGWSPRAISTGSDNQSRLLWTHTDTRASLWFLDPAFTLLGGGEFLP